MEPWKPLRNQMNNFPAEAGFSKDRLALAISAKGPTGVLKVTLRRGVGSGKDGIHGRLARTNDVQSIGAG